MNLSQWMESQNEAKSRRAAHLGAGNDFNGLKDIQVVSFEPTVEGKGGSAVLLVQFYNSLRVNEFGIHPENYFEIRGGQRVARFTLSQATFDLSLDPGNRGCLIQVNPLGDYSEYKLKVKSGVGGFDPLFSELFFRFRPDCYSTDCQLIGGTPPLDKSEIKIDYLARDYDRIRHFLFSHLENRVPGWKPSSEADLDQVLISLIAAEADQLSDFQDRVHAESHIGSARQRISLARHTRLINYYIHEGKQASTWMYCEPKTDVQFEMKPRFVVPLPGNDSQQIIWNLPLEESYFIDKSLNQLTLYTWGQTQIVLSKGTHQADLQVAVVDPWGYLQTHKMTKQEADDLVLKIQQAQRIWIEEILDPEDQDEGGKDLNKRQIIELGKENSVIETGYDPVDDAHFVRVHWDHRYSLQEDYIFQVADPQGIKPSSFFRGNLVRMTQGEIVDETFTREGMVGRVWDESAEGTLLSLIKGPLLFKELSNDGIKWPHSTVKVEVTVNDVPLGHWEEIDSLVHADATDNNGQKFVVETDEYRRSRIRFGNGINGQKLPPESKVVVYYQIGRGEEGNLGAEKCVFEGSYMDTVDKSLFYPLRVRNPWSIIDGVGPETTAQILRKAPESIYRHQLRIVTIDDLVKKAETLPMIAHAKAYSVWTGSWRAMRLLVDLKFPYEMNEQLLEEIHSLLDPLLMIGDELEVRSPKYVPLLIKVVLCAQPEFSCGVLQEELKDEFSSSFTQDGRRGFFHPDDWTFGQELQTSQILGRIHQVDGVDHVETLSFLKWGITTEYTEKDLSVGPDEIIQVLSNPNGAENGYISFEVKGLRP